MKRATPVIAFALLAVALLVRSAVAQEDPEVAIGRSAHELAGDLMSPYCPGRTLADCPSPDAGAVREEIRTALRAGEPVDSIRARIEARFGAAVVGVPTTTLGWALPILMLAAGALVLVLVLRRALSRPALHPRVSTDVAARLQRELRDVER